MEIAIPFLTLSALYIANNQKSKKDNNILDSENNVKNIDGFYSGKYNNQKLPNTNIADINYPEKQKLSNSDAEINTSELSQTNKYDGSTPYTEKYFNPSHMQYKMKDKILGKDNNQNLQNKSFISLTGERVGLDYFRHNNEQPFFGSTLKGSDGNKHYDAILDVKTGDGTYYKKKEEIAPLFQPMQEMSFAYGMPSQTNYLQDRQKTIASLKQNGISLNQPQTVARGLGLGATTEGHGGYNSSLFKRDLYMDKTVDELRPTSKPKSTEFMLYGHEGGAKHYNTKINDQSVIGQMNKNRPETYYENTPSRYMVAKSIYTAPTMHGIMHDKHTTRETQLAEYTGIANANELKANHSFETYGQTMDSKRQQLGEYPLGIVSAGGMGGATEADYNRNGLYFETNNRSFREGNDDIYFGGVGGAMGAVVAPLMDTLRPTRKENYIGTSRPFQNPSSKVSNSYLYDTTKKLPTTNRELYEENTFAGHINSTQTSGMGYLTNEVDAPTTLKEQTLASYFGGSSVPTRIAKNSEGELYNVDRTLDKKPYTDYTPAGVLPQFNNKINMEIRNNREEISENKRVANMQMRGQIPNTQTYGINTKISNNYQQNILLERNDGTVLSSLKNNPFAHNTIGAW